MKYPGHIIHEGEQDKGIVVAIQQRLIAVGCGVTDVNQDGKFEKLQADGEFGPQTIIPTALGVNPSLTISALSLRIADSMVAEL
jgi:hypothetical protein